jgi:hypothetical protein
MSQSETPRYRYLGVTDACTECEQCGKPELRSTVVLAPLDADGNPEAEPVYFGSTCAARALAVRGGGRAVLQTARNAHHATLTEAADARSRLAHYALPETGEPTAAEMTHASALFAHNHRNAVWAPTVADWTPYVLDLITRKRAALALAELVDPKCSYCQTTHAPRKTA